MRGARRGWMRGIRPWLAGAAVALVVGLLLVFAQLRSPDALLWTGKPLPGVDRGGLVTYHYRGVSFLQPLQGASDDPGPTAVTVDIDPNNPYDVLLDRPGTKLFEALLIGAPFLVAILLVLAGVMRQRRYARLSAREGKSPGRDFGHGIDPEVMNRLLQRNRGGGGSD